jgi:Protein of unknown function (DUF3306)
MSEEDFLARWSRRKLRAESDQPLPEPEQPAEMPPVEAAEEAPRPDIDLANLPPIDAIDAATDITAFLRKGIPQELSRAALRRAWSADPAIRDFIGLAENAWDFNDPNAMPGFGPLDWPAEQVEALVGRIVGSLAQAAEGLPNPVAEVANVPQSSCAQSIPAEPSDPSSIDKSPSPELQSAPAAPQPTIAEPAASDKIPVRRRTHGGALPS